MRAPSFFAVSALLLAALGCRDEHGSPTEPAATPSPAGVRSDAWITRAEMPRWRRHHVTATITNEARQSVMYVIGGVTIGGGLLPATNQAYNVATNRWRTAAPQPRSYWQGNGAGAIKGKIYISGGFHPSNEGPSASAALYMYDPVADTWTYKRSMPSRGMLGVTGVIGDRLYVLTGCPLGPVACDGDPVAAFYRYDPTTDSWATLPPPPRPHESGMAGVIGGKLYVVGGWDGTWYGGQLDVYDPAANRWATKASMPRERFDAAGVALGGKLYVIGGFVIDPDSSTRPVRTTTVYDPATDSWTRRAPLPEALGFLAASRVVLNGEPRIEVVSERRNLAYVP
jgi:N-acetylneuraminic acid mutarotase